MIKGWNGIITGFYESSQPRLDLSGPVTSKTDKPKIATLDDYVVVVDSSTTGPVSLGDAAKAVVDKIRPRTYAQVFAQEMAKVEEGLKPGQMHVILSGSKVPIVQVDLKAMEEIILSQIKTLQADMILDMKKAWLPKPIEVDSDHAHKYDAGLYQQHSERMKR